MKFFRGYAPAIISGILLGLGYLPLFVYMGWFSLLIIWTVALYFTFFVWLIILVKIIDIGISIRKKTYTKRQQYSLLIVVTCGVMFWITYSDYWAFIL